MDALYVRATLRPMYLFDVADSIRGLEDPNEPEAAAPTASHKPRYLGFDPPPRVIHTSDARIALFSFGVVGVQYAISFDGTWADLVKVAAALLDDAAIAAKAREHARGALQQADVESTYDNWLAEDYLIVEVAAGAASLQQNGESIAALVRGEVQPLAESEVREVLHSALSCYPHDLLVVGWAAAFVSDTPEGAQSTLQLLEFANAQLLELRHYGQRVREVLRGLYRIQQEPGRRLWWRRWRTVREVERLNQIRLEVVDLMERSDNSLRVLGDMFYARAYRTIAQRIGVDDYRKLVEERVRTAGEVYHFLVEESNHSRAFVLEAMVVLILVIELAMALTGKR